MAKKKKEAVENNIEGEEKRGSRIVSILIALVIVVIWLLVFALLIKLDVGGFGSRVLAPVLGDVPIINKILPGDAGYTDSEGNVYKTLDAAMARISELELALDAQNTSGSANADYIAQLEAEIARLQTFEDAQKAFEERVAEFDKEVVFNDKAPEIEEYKKFYEGIEPDNAATIYQMVVEQLQIDASIQEQGERFSKMDPATAADILSEMTGDLDLVCNILRSMKTQQSAEIIENMESEFAAKITKKMALME
jgi:flagellar motility protein MotE (MotC chaperone)